MDKATEKLLLSRAKKGELSAFEELVSAYEHRVYVFALRFHGSTQAAQKIAQEVFLEAYRTLKSFRSDSGLAFWLYRITLQRCTDYHPAVPDTSAPEAPASAADAPDSPALPTDVLQETISRLSTEQRQLLLLRDVTGLTYAEIGQLLTLEDSAIKTRLAQARRQLHDLLKVRVLQTAAAPAEGSSHA